MGSSHIRSAMRATRSRPTPTSLCSRRPGGRSHSNAPFAGIHTTSRKTQEAAVAAAPLTDDAPNTATDPKTLAQLKAYLPAWAEKADVLQRQIHRRYVVFTNTLRFEMHDSSRQRVVITRPYSLQVPPRILDAVYLRDRCICPQCVSPSSGNKSFSTAEIPLNIQFERIVHHPDHGITIHWQNDIPRFCADGRTHVSHFPATGHPSFPQLLKERSAPFAMIPRMRRSGYDRKLWDRKELLPRLLTVTYKNFMAGDHAFRKVVRELAVTGIAFLQNVPPTETAVADIALKFGAIKETFYGRTWDVKSKPDAENVAYTSDYLGLHSDMLYLESPPRIQLLHCLRNSCTGGESIFSDAFYAAHIVKDAGLVTDALTSLNVSYHYTNNGFMYRQQRPVLDFSGDTPDTHEVWWSPPFQAPFPIPKNVAQSRAIRAWHKAATLFQGILENRANVFQYKLRPGDCVLFDNRRVLHGRREFDPASGRRWLKGTYVADEDFVSTLNRIYREEKQETAMRREQAAEQAEQAELEEEEELAELEEQLELLQKEDDGYSANDFFRVLNKKVGTATKTTTPETATTTTTDT